jgi:stage V sporulation protein SpoVS
MYNIRYHLASLVAVFLALTVGLVLGTVVAERGTLDNQSTTLVDDLQKQFAQIQTDNNALRDGLERDRAFASDVVPALTADALSGETVAILVNGGRSNGLNATMAAIEDAGGIPVVLTFASPGLDLDSHVPDGISELLGEGFTEPVSAPVAVSFKSAVADALASELRESGSRPMLDLLSGSGALSISAPAEFSGVDACVLMTSFDGQPDDISSMIAGALDVRGAVVVGAEATNQTTGIAVEAVDLGFSAVDHVETPQGAYSLVWLLSDRASGYFGIGAGADAVYPTISKRG